MGSVESRVGAFGEVGEDAVVQPIREPERLRVEEVTEKYIRLAEEIFERRYDRIPVLFDLKGHTAGMFKTIGARRFIRYNPWIFAKYFTENLRDTVPHEVAHFVVHETYPRRGTKPHGPEWQDLMLRFGVDPQVTFDMDLEGVPQRRQARHRYHCGCQLHEVSTTRHNRMQKRRMKYHCVTCNGALEYLAPVR